MNIQMYPFFYRCARCLFSAMVLVCTLIGCSSGPTATIVALESTRVAHQDCRRLPGSSAPSIVYECKSDIGPVFVASLKDCSISEKFSFQATTRQLLVGMVGAKVAHQAPVTLGSLKALQSVVVGTVDAEPVIMSTFTFREKECVTDIVLWQSVAGENAQSPQVDTFSQLSRRLAASLLNEQFLVQDVTPTQG